MSGLLMFDRQKTGRGEMLMNDSKGKARDL